MIKYKKIEKISIVIKNNYLNYQFDINLFFLISIVVMGIVSVLIAIDINNSCN